MTEDGRVFGYLVVLSDRALRWTEEAVHTLEAFANDAAAAVRRLDRPAIDSHISRFLDTHQQ